MTDLTGLARDVDRMLTERALVFGSLPSSARDLDLLIRGRVVRQLLSALVAAGFVEGNGSWLRIVGTAAHVVDPVDVATWRLPDDAIEALFSQATVLPGLRHLADPDPAHRLLILARRLVPVGGRPGPAKLAQLGRLLREEPSAADRARAAAHSWGCRAQLEVLLDVHAHRRAISRREAWAGRLAEQGWLGRRRPAAAVRALRDRLRRSPVGAVVVLTGEDVSTVAVQRDRLEAGLRALGFDPVVAGAGGVEGIREQLRRGGVGLTDDPQGAGGAAPELQVRVDASRPADEVSAQLLVHVWSWLRAQY